MGTTFQLTRLAIFLGLLACASPAFAIVTAGDDPNAGLVSYGETVDGVNLSGIVEITSSIGGCTGSLLTGGLSILTAGHCVSTGYGSPIATGITVYFQSSGGMVAATVLSVQVDPGYTGDSTQGSDLAILTLTQPAPSYDIGYSLYTSTAIPTSSVLLAGYGYGGDGDTGANSAGYPFGTLREGSNVFEGDGADFFGWSSQLLVGQLFQPCDSISQSTCPTNALDVSNPYWSSDESITSHGDSGGPAFYDGQIIGVTDLGICLTSSSDSSDCATPPSVNASNDSYFGEMFADTSVADNLDFIEGVPEPGTIALMICALVCLAGRRIVRRALQKAGT